MELILEDVRCFSGKHIVPVKPLTILIGENSSGKTTLLACLSVISDLSGFPLKPGFNDPYSFGGYDTIATQRSKETETAGFSLGYQPDGSGEVVATYRNNNGKPELSKLVGTSELGEISLELSESHDKYNGRIRLSGDSEVLEFSLDLGFVETARSELPRMIGSWMAKGPKDTATEFSSSLFLLFLSSVLILSAPKTLSIAPIRSKPMRTYDQVSESFNPEGEHIPLTLANLFNTSSEQTRSCIGALERFGEDSGLFDTVGIKTLGGTSGGPFQMMVSIGGISTNLIDVGYGVSQALPILVQSILASDEKMLLLQQPEVHLHPKAQAALGSFFVDLVAEARKTFVVETHSDYIVDRVRQEIAAGKINPESVALLFFEKVGVESKIYHLEIDRLGNIVGAPPSYREFFLHEELNLITRGRH